MSRSVVAWLRVGAALTFAAALTGCITTQPNIVINARSGVTQPVGRMLAVVRVDGIPVTFGSAFADALRDALVAHGVDARTRIYSELELDGVTNAQVAAYPYLMVCHPSQIGTIQGSLLTSVTMNCVLTATRSGARMMSADVWMGKDLRYGPVTGVEAGRGAAEFVERMRLAGLVGGPALVAATDPAPASSARVSTLAPPAGSTTDVVVGALAHLPTTLAPPARLAPQPIPLPPTHVAVADLRDPPPPVAPPAPPSLGRPVVIPPPVIARAAPPPAYLYPPPQPKPTPDRVLYIKVLPDRSVQEVREGDH